MNTLDVGRFHHILDVLIALSSDGRRVLGHVDRVKLGLLRGGSRHTAKSRTAKSGDTATVSHAEVSAGRFGWLAAAVSRPASAADVLRANSCFALTVI